MTDTVLTGGRQPTAPTFLRDYAFRTLQAYFNPTDAVYVHSQASTPDKVLVTSYGECVSGDTMLITRTGVVRIKDAVGTEIEIWNGTKWSTVMPRKTRSNEALYRVSFSDNSHLDVTGYHRFSASTRHTRQEKEQWRTKTTLELQDKLHHVWATEPANVVYEDGESVDDAYSLGFAVGDGYVEHHASGNYVYVLAKLYGKKANLPLEGVRGKTKDRVGCSVQQTHFRFTSPSVTPERVKGLKEDADALNEAFSWDKASILSFVAGMLDADGNNAHRGGVRLSLSGRDRAFRLQLLLTKVGIRSTVCTLYEKGHVSNYGTRKRELCSLEIIDCTSIPCHRIDTSRGHKTPRFRGKYQTVKTIERLPGLHDVYCFTEPETHKGLFGNTLTFQCENPDGSEYSFLIPYFTSIVYDEYGELTPLGPNPQDKTRAWNTQPGNPLNLGQYAPDPYKLSVPQTNSYAGAGSSIVDYGLMAAHGKAAPGAPSKSVTSPRYATHIGDGMSYDPQFGNMGGAIANGVPVPAYTAVDATKNPTPKRGAPIKLHLGLDAKAHGLELYVDDDDTTTKAVGVKLAKVAPGLKFADDGGLQALSGAGANGFLAREGKNVVFGPALPVDAPVIVASTFGGGSTPGGRDIAYVWVTPSDSGPIDSAISPSGYAVTTATNGQINGMIPKSTIPTAATGLKVLARKTTDPSGDFYLLFTVPTYDPTADMPFSVAAIDSGLVTVQPAVTTSINVTDIVTLTGSVPDSSHTHLARGTLALGSWASKEDVAGFTYEGGNSGAHLFVALDGAKPADLGIAYAKNGSGGINVKSPWNLTVDWSAADVDGHHPLISERMGGVMRADGGVQTITLDHSPPTDADIPWPNAFGPIRDGIVAICRNDNSLWQRSSGVWERVTLPVGGSANQVLAKIDATNYNVEWIDGENPNCLCLTLAQLIELIGSVSIAVGSPPTPRPGVPPEGGLVYSASSTFTGDGSGGSIVGFVYGPSRAFDGNDATEWGATSGNSGEWCQVDFGLPITISTARVVQQISQFAATYTISSSLDGSTWTVRATGLAPAAGAQVLSFTPVSARFWRWTATSDTTGGGHTVFTFNPS